MKMGGGEVMVVAAPAVRGACIGTILLHVHAKETHVQALIVVVAGVVVVLYVLLMGVFV